MSLSKKKKEQLFGSVHEDIMKARIKIYKLLESKSASKSEIDNILGNLSFTAPENAVNLFNIKK